MKKVMAAVMGLALTASAWFGVVSIGHLGVHADSTKTCGTTSSGPFTQTTTQTSACNSNSTTGQQTTCRNPAGQVNTTSAHCK